MIQYVKKDQESLIDTFIREGFEAGRSKLNLSYYDESLDQLKKRHEELTQLNELLNAKMEELRSMKR